MTVEDVGVGGTYMIEWLDSSELTAWRWKEEVKGLGVTEVQTVGICYQVTDHSITMVLCLGNEGTDSEQVTGMICIPKGCIKSVKLLAP